MDTLWKLWLKIVKRINEYNREAVAIERNIRKRVRELMKENYPDIKLTKQMKGTPINKWFADRLFPMVINVIYEGIELDSLNADWNSSLSTTRSSHNASVSRIDFQIQGLTMATTDNLEYYDLDKWKGILEILDQEAGPAIQEQLEKLPSTKRQDLRSKSSLRSSPRSKRTWRTSEDR